MILAQFLDGRVTVKVGDLTIELVDAIVNAANSSLLGGGGVDGAIHQRGGPAIFAACKEIRANYYPEGLPTGEAVITTGGELPAKHLIHTVGPVYGRNNGRDAELLAACYRNCLVLAADLGLRSIAFPAISTGIYSYPQEEAAIVASETIRTFVEKNPTPRHVRLVFFSRPSAEIFLANQRF